MRILSRSGAIRFPRPRAEGLQSRGLRSRRPSDSGHRAASRDAACARGKTWLFQQLQESDIGRCQCDEDPKSRGQEPCQGLAVFALLRRGAGLPDSDGNKQDEADDRDQQDESDQILQSSAPSSASAGLFSVSYLLISVWSMSTGSKPASCATARNSRMVRSSPSR